MLDSMKMDPLTLYFRQRLRKRLPWAVVLVFSLVFTAIQFMVRSVSVLNHHPGSLANALLMPFFVTFSYGFLSPMPWRWTGDDRPRAPLGRGLLQAIPYNALLTLVLVSMSWLLVRHAQMNPEELGFRPGTKVSFGFILAMNLMIAVPLMTIIGGIIAYGAVTEEEKVAAETKLEEAQWVLLRGQLSPHVLFNSLNNLAELVRQDPPAAEQAILDLAGLYRDLLRHGDRPRAPLGDERALVLRYLSVEGLRLGPRLQATWAWDETLNDVEAPPFLLQPLVENALKHGIAPHPEGGDLAITLRRNGQGLSLSVRNSGRPMGLVLGDGIGLRNLEARLRLAYGSAGKFSLHADGAATVAEVQLGTLEMRR